MIRKVTEAEISMIRKMADEGPIECICNGDAALCICSLIIMICDELTEHRELVPKRDCFEWTEY